MSVFKTIPLIPLLDLRRPFRRLEQPLMTAARRVLASGTYILGPELLGFEAEFAQFHGSPHGVGVASGSDALELALQACGVEPGDWVATVSFTFLATADAILHVGARPLFVDIDPSTFTMDPVDLEDRIQQLTALERRRVKAVLPVHLYGHPCDMDAIRSVARRYRLKVVEDCAQAAGARWKGRPVGSLGDAGCFSFFPTKNLGAFGDAGMVVTDSASRAKRIRSLRVHGRGNGDLQVELGRNSRMDELQAALLRVKLRYLPEWLKRRREIAQRYTQMLSDVPGLSCPREAEGALHAYGLYVIRSRRRARIHAVLRRKGISSQVYYKRPVHLQPVYRGRFRRLRLPETERACREVLALPIFPGMRDEEVRAVACEVREAVGSAHLKERRIHDTLANLLMSPP